MSQPSSSLPCYSSNDNIFAGLKTTSLRNQIRIKDQKVGPSKSNMAKIPVGKKIVLLNAQKDLVTHLGGLCWIDTCEKAEFDAKAPQVKWRAGSLFKKRLYQTTFSSIIFQSMSNLCMFFAQHLRARVHKLQGQQQHVFLRLHPELQFH